MKIRNRAAASLAIVLASMSVLSGPQITLATQPTIISEELNDGLPSDDSSDLKRESESLSNSTIRTSVELSGGEFGTGFRDHDGTAYTGKGQIVVVIDGAFNPQHELIKDRVIEEACFGPVNDGANPKLNLCSSSVKPYPNAPGVVYSSGESSSKFDVNCRDSAGNICVFGHGVSTSSFAAGQSFDVEKGKGSGIAVDAKLILIKVGVVDRESRNTYWSSAGVAAAVDYVTRTLASKYPGQIAAISISDAGEKVADGDACTDTTGLNAAAGRAKSHGIPVVMASGNGDSNHIGFGAATGSFSCGDNIVNSGATNVTDLNSLVGYSIASDRTDLLAPVGYNYGDDDSANRLYGARQILTPGDPQGYLNEGVGAVRGTSYAAPQVAGAYAVLRQKWPTKSVDELTSLLQDSGVRVKDSRLQSTGIVTPRMVVGEAIRDRDARPSFDFSNDSRPDFPVVASNGKTLTMGSVGDNGVLTREYAAVAGDWSNKKFVAPVRDFLRNGTNGFITDQGSSFQYYEFDSNSGSLKAPVSIFSGLNASTERLAGVNGLKLPGTGKGVLVQGESGPIKLRMLFPETTQLGNAITVHDQDGLELVGSADLNQDGEPDLVMREKATGFPVAKMGTGNSTTPFAESVTYLSKAGFWPNMHHLFVMDDYAGGKTQLGYQSKASRKMVMFPLESDGTLAPSSEAYTAASWAEGVRILMANDY